MNYSHTSTFPVLHKDIYTAVMISQHLHYPLMDECEDQTVTKVSDAIIFLTVYTNFTTRRHGGLDGCIDKRERPDYEQGHINYASIANTLSTTTFRFIIHYTGVQS